MDQLAHAVIGAAIEVHRNLGPGYSESIYEQAMAVELDLRRIAYKSQFEFDIEKCAIAGKTRVDSVSSTILIIELKAVVEALAPIHTAQLLSYLKAGSSSLD